MIHRYAVWEFSLPFGQAVAFVLLFFGVSTLRDAALELDAARKHRLLVVGFWFVGIAMAAHFFLAWWDWRL